MMGELQVVDMRTPIEIALDIDSEGMTTARKLYEFLELDSRNYSRWCKRNITENEFAEENVDYWAFVIEEERNFNPNQTTDYRLTAHFAKKLSVKGNGEKSEQAREYFARLEERIKQKAIDLEKLDPQTRLMNLLVQEISRNELEQKRQAEELKKHEEQLKQIEQTQTAIADAFQQTDDEEEFQKWVNSCITKIAESPTFSTEFSRNERYAKARKESYNRLMQKRSCRLDDRVQRAVGRALKERPDIKKSELQKINKLYVIANDKDLKPAYELVIKEMMMCYCTNKL